MPRYLKYRIDMFYRAIKTGYKMITKTKNYIFFLHGYRNWAI